MNGESLRTMLQRHEGYRKTKYKCSEGFWTVGIGHNMDANPLPTDMQKHLDLYGYLTDRMIEKLFQADIDAATESCKRLYPELYTFTLDRRNALIDFLFNVGEGTAKTFKQTNKAINEGRWGDAAKGMKGSLYWKQLGGDPPGTDDGKLERPEEIARMLEGDGDDEPEQEKPKQVADESYPLDNMGAI